ncbi:MAG: hypothetical protein AAFV53_13930 [Myxococcota bacterium]
MRAEDAIQTLQTFLEEGRTGCLSSRSAAAYRVYVMQGDILAAHGPDDGIWVVRRLVNNGAITEGQGRQVIFYLGQGYRLEELLLDQVPDQLFLDLLMERFRQNLLDFAFLRGSMDFEEMEAIFVDNIQVGHDSFALLDDVLRLRDRIAPLRRQLDALRLAPGGSRPRSRDEARILDLCGTSVRLDELVVLSPFEEGPTLDLVQEMLQRGSLVQAPSRTDGQTPAPPPNPTPTSTPTSAPTVTSTSAPTAAPTAAPAPRTPRRSAPTLAPEVEEPDTDVGPIIDDTQERTASMERTEPLEPSEIDDLNDEPTNVEEEEDMSLFSVDAEDSGAHGEDEMAMFTDQDVYRGGGRGQFTLEKRLLDRVDLSKPIVESKPPEAHVADEMLEMGDASEMDDNERTGAMALSFGPPPMEIMEQRRKVAVCNDVLHEVAAALDAAHGSGSGRAFIQLLLDGTPHQYAILFMGVETDTEGRIDADHVIRNLQRRPDSEHRRLLNMGVRDLIERALSSGMEELDEASMDSMLQRVAGYQMRLGL